MEERQITVAKTTHVLPPLFMVMATQNPIEQEGTYPLPEAQMDRFLMHVNIDYPAESDEADIVRLVRSEESGNATAAPQDAEEPRDAARSLAEEPAISQDAVFAARADLTSVHVSEAIERYIVDLVFATRFPDRYSEQLATWIDIGASPRGSIGLDKCARVHAWLHAQDHVAPDNVRAVVHDVFRHRLKLSYEAQASRVSADRVIDEIVSVVAVA
jgi:MoxR-like ATPase